MENSNSPPQANQNSSGISSNQIRLIKGLSEEANNGLGSSAQNRVSQRIGKSYLIDQAALIKYKGILQKRVAWSFILLFVVIIERIFAGYTQDAENDIIAGLQSFFDLAYNKKNGFLANIFIQPVIFLEQYLYSFILMTHFFTIVYYYHNAVICLKIMIVQLNAIAIISIFETIFGDPRPYWVDKRIIGAGCDNSYGFPSFTVFCILFLFMYSWHCLKNDPDDEESSWSAMDLIKTGFFSIVFVLYCFSKVLAGYDYISQTALASLYSFLFYQLATFFDKTITDLVEKSTVDVQNAKRNSVFWMIYLLIIAGLSTFIYESSETFLDISWFQNYLICLTEYGQTSVLETTPYYHLVGAWGSFLKTAALFLLLGGIFGAAKAFRDFRGTLWYATTRSNRIKMTLIANLCLIPSWIIIYFESSFILTLQQNGINVYIFNAIHFTVLYLLIFGFLPKYVFDKLGLLNRDVGYHFFPEEPAVKDESEE